MFCSNCGHKNAVGNKFCEECGYPLDDSKGVQREGATKISSFRKLSSIAGVFVIICFFLPWVMVSCSRGTLFGGDIEIQVSGMELATGRIKDLEDAYGMADALQNFSNQVSDSPDIATPELFLFLVFALGSFFALNNKKSGSIVAFVCGIAGIIFLVIFGIKFFQLKDEVESSSYSMLSMKIQGGYILSWLGFIAQTVLGVLGMKT